MRLLAGTVVSSRHLHCATVVRPSEDACQVLHEDQLAVVKYSAPFKPRAERLTPGQLVAIASTPEGSQVVVWRWFDAVVLEDSAGRVLLWEPAHGEVLAQPRNSRQGYRPGSRAYLSAGLPGADWWVAGPVGPAENAEVELDEVHQFYTRHDLWRRLSGRPPA